MKTIRYCIAASLLLALTACGSGGSDAPPVTPPVVTPPVPMLDAFFKAVQAVIGIAPDTEPSDIAAVAVTEPDNTEPDKVE